MGYLARHYDPKDAELSNLLLRSSAGSRDIRSQVFEILEQVRQRGDEALITYAKLFDRVELSELRVCQSEIETAIKRVPESLKQAIRIAKQNIEAFHKAQLPKGETLKVMQGVQLSRRVVPVNRVGLYIPGGTAPLFSTVLMLAVPASVAGCKGIMLCTPCDSEGQVNPTILYAATVCGVTEILKVGGAQAIAAMAYGTQTIKAVDKIFGPGNRYVTEAKAQVAATCCAIDMPAGPSEVMVLATPASNPAFVASDLLSQAEHGMDSQVMLVVIASKAAGTSFLNQVDQAIEAQLASLNRTNYLLSSLSSSRAIVVPTPGRCIEIANAYAPEHLIINTSDEALDDQLLQQVSNAGSVFLGPYSCESAGDYASGTNHTLPTNGWARSMSGVSTDSFLKKITIQKLTKTGLKALASTIMTMAENEQLDAHRSAVSVRLEEMK